MLYKICRLCPNTARWTRPTKKVGENRNAYTSKFGFGFEEWMNREEWVLSGYGQLNGEWRYAHIQGVWTKNNIHEGKNVTILFYVKERGDDPRAVAYLENAYVIDEQEAAWVATQFTKNHWFHLMYEEVKSIGGDTKGLPSIPQNTRKLKWENPLYYTNVRFRPGSLHFFDEPKFIDIPSYYYSTALGWDGVLPTKSFVTLPIDIPTAHNERPMTKELNRFSEKIRKSRTRSEKPFLPRQAPIQNNLAVQLDRFYRPKGYLVKCEHNRVDITLESPKGGFTFIEIKPASTAREAIRIAIGQLLEYANYPSTQKAKKLIIVSDAEPTSDDWAYLKQLHTLYTIPVDYVYWPLGAKELPEKDLKKIIQ